eukprot:TRINITY_DN13722_c0_g1_i1.p1 TRINITY_DN13722_c0_g1~~TRINITY_DN13722_c0_g1_i1.p1  ORF type:complete len:181 (-),score=58.28 TRINITY_DN13722_c0_g1_i1:136-678(-)
MEIDNDNSAIPEGVRMKKLRESLLQTLKKSMEKVNEEDFINSFSKFDSEKEKEILKAFHNRFEQLLLDSVESEFEVICEEKDVQLNLNKLDQKIQEERLSMDIDVSEGNPNMVELDSKELILKYKQEELERREHILKQLEKEKLELIEKIQEKQQIVQNFQQNLRDENGKLMDINNQMED